MNNTESATSLHMNILHERAMRAMELAIVCGFKKRPGRQAVLLNYALHREIAAIQLAHALGEATTTCLLRKSAAILAGKLGKLEVARKQLDAALNEVPAIETDIKKDLQATDKWLKDLEEKAGIRVKKGLVSRVISSIFN